MRLLADHRSRFAQSAGRCRPHVAKGWTRSEAATQDVQGVRVYISTQDRIAPCPARCMFGGGGLLCLWDCGTTVPGQYSVQVVAYLCSLTMLPTWAVFAPV